MSNNVCLGFNVEWYDSLAELLHFMQIKYFLSDGTIEILEKDKIFLKRIYYPEIKLEHLFIGNSVTIYNRLLVIKSFCNVATENYMNARETHVVCHVTNAAVLGEVLVAAKRLGFRSARSKTSSASYLSSSGVHVRSGDILYEIVGNRGAEQYSQLVDSCKRLSGCQFVKTDAKGAWDILVECEPLRVGSSRQCTLCMIKPHVVERKDEGEVIKTILDQGYDISAVVSLQLTKAMASEIFDVYRAVVPSYTRYMDEIMSGTCIALMVERSSSPDIVSDFREVAGPFHSELAKVLRPDSLRGKFGIDGVKNAVHCTDTSEDGNMECQYFFETLASM